MLFTSTGCSKVYEEVEEGISNLLFNTNYKEAATQACHLAYTRNYDSLLSHLGHVNSSILLQIRQKTYFGFDDQKLPQYDIKELQKSYSDEMCAIHSMKKGEIRNSNVTAYEFSVGKWDDLLVYEVDNKLKVQFNPDDFMEHLYVENPNPIVKKDEKILSEEEKSANYAYKIAKHMQDIENYRAAINIYKNGYKKFPNRKTAKSLVECYTALNDKKNADIWSTNAIHVKN